MAKAAVKAPAKTIANVSAKSVVITTALTALAIVMFVLALVSCDAAVETQTGQVNVTTKISQISGYEAPSTEKSAASAATETKVANVTEAKTATASEPSAATEPIAANATEDETATSTEPSAAAKQSSTSTETNATTTTEPSAATDASASAESKYTTATEPSEAVNPSGAADSPTAPKIAPAPALYELALISDFGLIGDNSITQAVWDGLSRRAAEKSATLKHYIPKNQSVGAYLDAVNLAVNNGAKLIAVSGVLFETPVWIAQYKCPDTRFILVDAVPHNEDYTDVTVMDNVAVIRFNACESGFLAGYAAVRAGYRRLGFIGAMPEPEITDAGLGFIQGAEYAAGVSGLPDESVLIRYAYAGSYFMQGGSERLLHDWMRADGAPRGAKNTGDETDSDETVSFDTGAGGDYAGAVETVGVNSDADAGGGDTGADAAETGGGELTIDLLFAVGGGLEPFAVKSAEGTNVKVILFEDGDGYAGASGSNISSPIVAVIDKNYSDAVYDCVSAYYSGKFPGGAISIYGASEGGIGLRFTDAGNPMLGQEEYVAIASALASGIIKPSGAERRLYAPPSPESLELRAVVVSTEKTP